MLQNRRDHPFLWCVSILSIFLLVSCVEEQDLPEYLVIENVEVIDAVNLARPRMTVVISGSIIVDVRSESEGRPSNQIMKRATRVNGEGLYLIPGLWDAHVHLTFEPGLGYETFFPLAIVQGITSLRDTGGQLDALENARRISLTDPEAPDLYVAGPLIDGAKPIYDGSSALLPRISVAAHTPQDAVRIVDELAARGVDFIKAYEMLDAETFKAVVERAMLHGLPVAAHPPLRITASQAADFGVRDFQHFRNLEFECSSQSDDLLSERLNMINHSEKISSANLRRKVRAIQRPKALNSLDNTACEIFIRKLADKTVFQTPTMMVLTLGSTKRFLDADWQRNFKYLPEGVETRWLATLSTMSNELRTTDKSAKYFNWLAEMIPALSNAGVPIMAGTDAPIGFQTPGFSLHDELELLVDFGLTPLEALEAATLSPSKFFKLDSQQGLISPGMKANLVLLRSDPLENITNTRDIEAVIKNGHFIDALRLKTIQDGLQGR